MSEDRFELNGLGTVEVEFDGNTYRLTRPKMGQWRYFQRKLQGIHDDSRSKLLDLTEKAETATGKAKAKAEAELTTFAATPLHEYTIDWMREVFDQLGDKPLPADSDDWPAWLAADSNLPIRIVAHWKTSPLVSGSPAR